MILLGELIGMLLASYGLLRESFAGLAASRPFGEGRMGEGPYGGAPTVPERRFVRVGVWLGVLPRDGKLTLTDRKLNAKVAIAGVFIGAVALVCDVFRAFASHG